MKIIDDKSGEMRKLAPKLRTYKGNMQKRLWQRWHNPNGFSTPAFLIGNGRSGTSMIVSQLAKSWQVDLYNEDHPAAFDDWHLRDLSEIEVLVRHSFARVTLFKPIKDTFRIKVILSKFPHARTLFVFRHYDDVVNSSLKKFYDSHGNLLPIQDRMLEDRRPPVVRWVTEGFSELSEAPPPRDLQLFLLSKWTPDLNLESNIALHWLFTNRLYYDLNLQLDERIKLINYESVVLEPKKRIEEICKFLGLEFEENMVKGIFSSSVKRDFPPKIDSSIRSDCEELWQTLCASAEERGN